MNLTTHSGMFLNLVVHGYEILASFLGHLTAVENPEQGSSENFYECQWGTESENLKPSTNKLEETPCLFFVTIY